MQPKMARASERGKVEISLGIINSFKKAVCLIVHAKDKKKLCSYFTLTDFKAAKTKSFPLKFDTLWQKNTILGCCGLTEAFESHYGWFTHSLF